MTTENEDLLERIKALVDEEHLLRGGSADEGADRARLSAVEAQLDQCWDLLRQRRAAVEYGTDPGQARVRPVGEVEGYQQ